MALYTLNPIFTSIRGSIGNLIFTSYRGKPVIRRKSTKKRMFNDAQRKSQSYFGRAVALWKTLTQEEKTSWEEIANGKNITPYNGFISVNTKRANQGLMMIRVYTENPEVIEPPSSQKKPPKKRITHLNNSFSIISNTQWPYLSDRFELCNSPPPETFSILARAG